MIVKFTGPCVDTTKDKKGTLYLIIEETSEGKPITQKVKCYGKVMDSVARGVRLGDMVSVDARLEARRWVADDGTVLWFDNLQAQFIEVLAPDTKASPPQPPPDDSEVPF